MPTYLLSDLSRVTFLSVTDKKRERFAELYNDLKQNPRIPWNTVSY